MRRIFRNTPQWGVYILCISLFPSISIGQSLPDQIKISEDGTQLLKGGDISEGFYDETLVRSIYLEFYDPDFWQLMMDNYNTDNYVLAKLSYEQEVFDSVAVQFKGQTSFKKPVRRDSEKLSFSVKLDEIIDGQDIDGYNNFNFNNAYQDESFMAEVLYGRLSRELLPAVRGNFIRLYLNGEDWGLYPNIQQVDGDFIKEWFFSNDGIRWRADTDISNIQPLSVNESLETNPQWGDGTAALNYLGGDTTEYQQYYTLKKSEMDDPWSYLVKVCDILNNTPSEALKDSLSLYMDIDATLWFLAQEILFSDDDSYVFKGKMDYYLYLDDETGKMHPLEFDGNSAMNINNLDWSPFLNEEDENYPLLNRLLAIPELRQRYLAHAKSILNQAFDTEKTEAIIDQYAALIDPHLQSDPKIDFPYGRHTFKVSELKRYINERRTYVMAHPEFNMESPKFGEVTQWVSGDAWRRPVAGEEVIVKASATHPEGISGINVYFAIGFNGDFKSMAMSDDGTGADAEAGDGIYSASMPKVGPGNYVRWYVEAIAGDSVNTVSYLPEAAAHDLFLYNVDFLDSQESNIVINEFLAANDNVHSDEVGEFDDWIEIYNLSDYEVSLFGYHLSDDNTNFAKWTFPDVSIDAGSYLLVWADSDPEQGPLHTNFKISGDGEELILTDPEGNLVDRVSFDAQKEDISYGRWPNGTGDFSAMLPSFSAANNPFLTYTTTKASKKFLSLYPNPADQYVRIEYSGETPEEIAIYSLHGQQLYRSEFKETLDVSSYKAGIYILKSGGESVLLKVY